MTLAIFIASWIAIGLGSYHYARKSWSRRRGDDSAPLNYWVGGLLGFGSLGFVAAELLINWQRGK